MVDNIDKKILQRLHKNSRSPVSSIAKDTSLTREVVGYRIKKMEEESIIRGYPAKINQAFFCEGVANILLKVTRTDSKRFKEILNYLQNHRAVNWIAELSGNADIAATFLYKNTEDIGTIVSEILDFIGANLREHRLSLYITEYKFEREGILSQKAKQAIPEAIVSFKGKKEIKLDRDDIIILRELSKNSRTKNIEIAEKTSLSEDMIRLRIKKLEKQKIIFGYGVEIDTSKLGLEAYQVEMQIENLTKEISGKLQYYVHSNPYIIYCVRSVGKYNVIMTLHAKNNAHFNELLLDLRNQFGNLLTDYEFQLEIKEHKEVYVPEDYIE
ncbi:Lrp/AsnC family transcriptional regulator [Candidatus Woesearchaeota archaeon]|nr:Lrp/AsnC family transcriptional regulator [Candidatus Woesearchaeota archaeon]